MMIFGFENRRQALLFALVVALTSRKTYYVLGGTAAVLGGAGYVGYKIGYDKAKPAEVRQVDDINKDGLEDLVIKDRSGRERFFVKQPDSKEYTKIKRTVVYDD